MAELAPPDVPRHRAAVSWLALYAAIALDAAQVFALDYSAGFTDPVLATAAIIGFLTEVYLFAIALRRVNTAVAYALFGLGTVAVAVISIGWLGEPLTPFKALALVAVLAGAVLLNTGGTATTRVVRAQSDTRASALNASSSRG